LDVFGGIQTWFGSHRELELVISGRESRRVPRPGQSRLRPPADPKFRKIRFAQSPRLVFDRSHYKDLQAFGIEAGGSDHFQTDLIADE
jgi:hypothetical protein